MSMKSWNRIPALPVALGALLALAVTSLAQDQSGPTKDVDQTVAKPRKSTSEPEQAPAPPQALDEAQAKQKAQLLKAAEDLDKKLQAIEHRLVSQALLNSDDKYFVEPYAVYLNLIWLNAEVGTGGGDVAGSADFAPTKTQRELLKTCETEMAGVDADYRKFLKDDLLAFSHALESGNLAPLVAPAN